MRERLSCLDIERGDPPDLGRGGPRELAALRQSLGETASVREMLAVVDLVPLPERLAGAQLGLGEHGVLVERLDRALAAELPLFARDGGFIAAGYSDELDEWKSLRDESRRMIAALQARYAGETAIGALKIRHNNVIGYYLEVSANHAGKLGPELSTARRWRARSAHHSRIRVSKPRSPAPPSGSLELRLEDRRGDGPPRRDRCRRGASPPR